MTAKEYIRNSELLKKSWTNENRDLFLIDYEDLLKVLADFATINCKEQRELCGLAIQENNYYSNMTTKQPNIESEGIK